MTLLNKISFQVLLLISRISLKILYLISDLIFILLFYVVGYRKKVVLENLKNSFPNKSEKELVSIRRNFYRNFADYLVETIKSFSISAHELKVRVQHINRDVFQKAHHERRNVILLTGHVFNWEWFTALATMVPQEKSFPVYRKIQNEFWDEKIRTIRNANGNHSIEAQEVMRHIFRNKNDGNSIYMLVADQTPYGTLLSYGLTFLNQKTPVFIGYDKLATRMDLMFIYCDMKKVKRGFYQVNYSEILPDGEKFKEYEVVKKFHQQLEETIYRDPANYLWSHRKWKYVDSIKVFDAN